MAPIPLHKVIQVLPLEGRHQGILCRIADGELDIRALVRGATEETAQKPHGAGRVRKLHEPHFVNGRDQEPAGDAAAFLEVVVLAPTAAWRHALRLCEADDEPGARSRKGLCQSVPSGARASSHSSDNLW